MNKIQVLDTTLRDGGYCNDWNFGLSRIGKIVNGLSDAGIEIIECGFLTNKVVTYEKGRSKFANMQNVTQFIPANKKKIIHVCMINYGEYSVEHLPECTEDSIEGIRVAFHKKNRIEAIDFCKKIQEKGYKVFVQPMVSLSYTDEEFLRLISLINSIQPYAAYIVDSFGTMKSKELMRLFYMMENNLDKNIWIGYHAHNNLQLAYSNARLLTETITSRNLIIDSSIFGMGRGAGNLNTELFVEYLNEVRGTNYKSIYLLRIIDEILMPIYNRNYWGFSIPYYISAINDCHPNYASFLDARKTLTVENMEYIMERISSEKKNIYDEAYIQQLYMDFMTRDKLYIERTKSFDELVVNREILLIAPGRSINEEEDKIRNCMKNNPIVISVNFIYARIDIDFAFISNIRRFDELDNKHSAKIIATSNIESNNVYMKIDYASNISDDEYVKDNAGLMLIHYLSQKNVKKIYLAGFDGFSTDIDQNYVDKDMAQISNKNILKNMNTGLIKVFKEYSKSVPLEFVTTPQVIKF